jgi:outer membrane protein, heavy metal efflux system
VKRGIIIAAALAFVLSNGAACWAQRQLSLRQAIDQALESRASLKAQADQVLAAQGLKRQATLLANPEFQFQNENLRPGQTYTRDVDTLAMINQSLDILGKRKQRIALAGEGINRAQAEYGLARWQVVQQVKSAYWAALGSQQIRDVLKNSADNFQRIVRYDSSQLSAGAIAEQDYLRVRLEGERLQISADLAGIDANRLRLELLKEMGEANFPELTLTEPLVSKSEIEPLGVEEALNRRMEVKVARAALDEAKASAKLQDVLARPDLNVTYGYKRTQLPDTTTGVNTAIVSVRVTLPTTDKNQGNRSAAEAEVRRQEEILTATETEIRAEYQAALQEYEARRSELRTALEPLREHAAEIASIASAAYAAGGTDVLRLLDAERSRLDAELAWTRGMVDYRQSIDRLEAAEGVIE